MEKYKSTAKSFKITINDFDIDDVLEKLNKIKIQNPDYNIVVVAEKIFNSFDGGCPNCENSEAVLVVRGRKKDNQKA